MNALSSGDAITDKLNYVSESLANKLKASYYSKTS